jgi:hypothetical protein
MREKKNLPFLIYNLFYCVKIRFALERCDDENKIGSCELSRAYLKIILSQISAKRIMT